MADLRWLAEHATFPDEFLTVELCILDDGSPWPLVRRPPACFWGGLPSVWEAAVLEAKERLHRENHK